MPNALLIDTRQQDGKHRRKHDYFASVPGLTTMRTKVTVGDYMLVGGTISVDTKRNVLELAQDIDHEHDRFRKECETARDLGIELVVLVENDDGIMTLDMLPAWENPRRSINQRKGLKPPIDGRRLYKACMTMSDRYGVRFEFCTPAAAGPRVLQLLGLEVGTDG